MHDHTLFYSHRWYKVKYKVNYVSHLMTPDIRINLVLSIHYDK